MRFTFLCLLAIVLLSSELAAAEMYQWVDKNGVLTFKDTPPPPSQKQKQRRVKVYGDGDFNPAPAPTVAASRGTAVPSRNVGEQQKPQKGHFSGTVEMYITDWCGYCRKAQSYMTSNGIPFVAYNIEKDAAAKERHAALGGKGVPLIIIGSQKMSGWSPDAFEHYMNNSQ